jgi:hypothetical protein
MSVPEVMIDVAKKLATDEATRGNIGVRFIPQAMTWLNQQRWSDHAAVAFMLEQAGGQLSIEQAVRCSLASANGRGMPVGGLERLASCLCGFAC